MNRREAITYLLALGAGFVVPKDVCGYKKMPRVIFPEGPDLSLIDTINMNEVIEHKIEKEYRNDFPRACLAFFDELFPEVINFELILKETKEKLLNLVDRAMKIFTQKYLDMPTVSNENVYRVFEQDVWPKIDEYLLKKFEGHTQKSILDANFPEIKKDFIRRMKPVLIIMKRIKPKE